MEGYATEQQSFDFVDGVASPIFTVALAISMVRMNKPIRAKTSATMDRTFDLALFPRE